MDREREAWAFAAALLRHAVGEINPYRLDRKPTEVADVADMVRTRFPEVGPAFHIRVTLH